MKATLKQAAVCISQHSLLKSGQQIRDRHVAVALGILLPNALVGIINCYAAEQSFLPLEFNNDGYALFNSINQPILDPIHQIILSDEPDKHQFQLEMVKNHGGVLDALFAPDLDSPGWREVLNQVALNQPHAIAHLRTTLQIMTNYLPCSQSQTLLERRSTILKTYSARGDGEAIHINRIIRDLLAEAIQQINRDLQHCHQAVSIQSAKADALLAQARAQLIKKDTGQACKLMLEAVNVFCQLRERHRVGEILVQLIKLGEMEQAKSYPVLLKFFGLAKKLCLVYPADFRLYADLLFAMLGVCEKRRDFSTAHRLIQEAFKNGIRLPVYYESRLVALQIWTQYRTGQSTASLVQQIKAALDNMNQSWFAHIRRITSSADRPDDLNYLHIHISRCQLYQLLGQLAAEQLDQLHGMNFEQQDNCVSQFILEPVMEYARRELSTEPSQRYTDSELGTPLKWLVFISAHHYRQAIKNLLVLQLKDEEPESLEKEALAVYDGLVSLYLKAEAVDELDDLLEQEKAYKFLQLPSFEARLITWRASLLALKETLKKTKASELQE